MNLMNFRTCKHDLRKALAWTATMYSILSETNDKNYFTDTQLLSNVKVRKVRVRKRNFGDIKLGGACLPVDITNLDRIRRT